MTNSGHNPIPDPGDGSGGSGTGSGCIPIDRVEWSRNTILEFIEDYREYRVLWDPNTKGYHIKQIKYEALKKLSRKYNTEVRIIRSKIKSLRSSFHREHGKVISGKRRGINYQPMWFAYEAIRFILDGEREEMGGGSGSVSGFDGAGGGEAVGGSIATGLTTVGADMASVVIDASDEMVTLADENDDAQYTSITAEDVKTEILEASSVDVEDIKTSVQHRPYDKVLRKRKLRPSNERPIKTEALSHQQRADSDSDDLQNNSCQSSRPIDASTSDEFGVFGEYVGITIRKLKTNKAKVVIKHLINNLLYDAEMGKYDYGIPTSREPPHLYTTAD